MMNANRWAGNAVFVIGMVVTGVAMARRSELSRRQKWWQALASVLPSWDLGYAWCIGVSISAGLVTG